MVIAGSSPRACCRVQRNCLCKYRRNDDRTELKTKQVFHTLRTSSFLFSHVTASLCHRERPHHVCAPRQTLRSLKEGERKATRKAFEQDFPYPALVFFIARRSRHSWWTVVEWQKKDLDSSIPISCCGRLKLPQKKKHSWAFLLLSE